MTEFEKKLNKLRKLSFYQDMEKDENVVEFSKLISRMGEQFILVSIDKPSTPIILSKWAEIGSKIYFYIDFVQKDQENLILVEEQYGRNYYVKEC